MSCRALLATPNVLNQLLLLLRIHQPIQISCLGIVIVAFAVVEATVVSPSASVVQHI